MPRVVHEDTRLPAGWWRLYTDGGVYGWSHGARGAYLGSGAYRLENERGEVVEQQGVAFTSPAKDITNNTMEVAAIRVGLHAFARHAKLVGTRGVQVNSDSDWALGTTLSRYGFGGAAPITQAEVVQTLDLLRTLRDFGYQVGYRHLKGHPSRTAIRTLGENLPWPHAWGNVVVDELCTTTMSKWVARHGEPTPRNTGPVTTTSILSAAPEVKTFWPKPAGPDELITLRQNERLDFLTFGEPAEPARGEEPEFVGWGKIGGIGTEG